MIRLSGSDYTPGCLLPSESDEDSDDVVVLAPRKTRSNNELCLTPAFNGNNRLSDAIDNNGMEWDDQL